MIESRLHCPIPEDDTIAFNAVTRAMPELYTGETPDAQLVSLCGAVVHKPTLWAQNSTATTFGREPSCLGSYRVVLRGGLEFVCFPICLLIQLACRQSSGMSREAISTYAILQMLGNLRNLAETSPAECTSLFTEISNLDPNNGSVVRGWVGPGELLYIPACSVCITRTRPDMVSPAETQSCKTFGLRMSVYPHNYDAAAFASALSVLKLDLTFMKMRSAQFAAKIGICSTDITFIGSIIENTTAVRADSVEGRLIAFLYRMRHCAHHTTGYCRRISCAYQSIRPIR